MAARSEGSSTMPSNKDSDNDPDYEEIYVNHREKELEVQKQSAKEATIRKIENVINNCFAQEIQCKESELETIQKNIMEAKLLMDHLRACIVTKYYYKEYFKSPEESENPDWLHPKVKECTGKAPVYACPADVQADHDYPKLALDPLESGLFSQSTDSERKEHILTMSGTTVRKNVKLVVGNISKYILSDERSSNQDQATHKWMIYVRPQDSHAEDTNLISRIVVFLHPSYKPNDLVEINKPPFCVCRRGWGEFPIRVQIHFHDSRNKAVDVIHQLKLDKTYTGLQTLGGETLVEVPLYTSKDKSPIKPSSKPKHSPSATSNSNVLLNSAIISSNSSEREPTVNLDTNRLHNVHSDSVVLPKLDFIKQGPCEIKWTEQPSVVHSITDLPSLNSCEQFSEIPAANSWTTDLERFENASLNHGKESLIVPHVINQKPPVHLDVSNSSTALNNSSNIANPEVKAEGYLRIMSAVPIQIQVRPKSTGLSCDNNEVVHYFRPNADGVCLVPISLLKSSVRNEKPSESPQVSWNLKAKSLDQKLHRYTANLRPEEYSNVHEIMLHLIKLYPLISEDPHHPYCALSKSQFDGWTIGRKLAAEWQRSRQVQKALTRIIDTKHINEKPWSVKEILRWARKHGFSPRTVSADEEHKEESVAGPTEVFGLTSSEQLLSTLASQFGMQKEMVADQSEQEHDETVDVESQLNESDLLSSQDVTNSQTPDSEEGTFVREVLFQVCKDVIRDILHQSLGESSCRLKSHSPTNISCIDVYSAIQNLSFCDLLTNKHMGIEQL